MSTIIFPDVIFGPVQSRRLGISLGVNLLPLKGKLCSFDCIYCECGSNAEGRSDNLLPTRDTVKSALEEKLKSMRLNHEKLDTLTFAGNGEPTLHPDFGAIVDDVITLRDQYFPEVKISVLSNASMIQKDSVFKALLRVDNNILKLDAALDDKIRLIDQPNSPLFNIESLVAQLKRFNGRVTIQTMFLRGMFNDQSVDNTQEEDISGLVKLLKQIKPQLVMIYSLDRETPVKGLEKIPFNELSLIADKLRCQGFSVSVV